MFKLSLSFASFAFNLNIPRTLELIKFVIVMSGLKIERRIFIFFYDLVATLSGFIAAIVFGVISENINITKVSITEPNKTLPPK